jgi:hypothetical protein
MEEILLYGWIKQKDMCNELLKDWINNKSDDFRERNKDLLKSTYHHQFHKI